MGEITPKKVAILGATGLIGQRFMEFLVHHPWFEIVQICGNKTAGKRYYEARHGYSSNVVPDKIHQMKIDKISELDFSNVDLVFSALPDSVADKAEAEIATLKPIITTAAINKFEEDIPIFHPILNSNHLKLIEKQQQERGWKGFILAMPTPSAAMIAMSAYPIFKKFGIKSLHVTATQSISSSLQHDVRGYDILNNIIPNLKEEQKITQEVKKIFGYLEEIGMNIPDFPMDVLCNQIPIREGILESIFLQTVQEASIEEIKEVWSSFSTEIESAELPSLPKNLIQTFSDMNRPQPQIDLNQRFSEQQAQIMIGGYNQSNFKKGIKYSVLSQNNLIGGSRLGILSAELLVKNGII